MIQFNCSACGYLVRAPEDCAGRTSTCPKCRIPITVPPLAAIVILPLNGPAPHTVAPLALPSAHPAIRAQETVQVAIFESKAKQAHSLGIASTILGVVALLFSLIPCIAILSLPISTLGLALAGFGFIVALKRDGHGIGYPVAGLALNGLALLIALVWMGLAAATNRHLDDASKARTAETRNTSDWGTVSQGQLHPSVSKAETHGESARPSENTPVTSSPSVSVAQSEKPTAGDQKATGQSADSIGTVPVEIDPNRDTEPLLQKDDFVFRVKNCPFIIGVGVHVGDIVTKQFGEPSRTKKRYLKIVVVVHNTSESLKRDYHGWSTSDPAPTLTDDVGNTYRRIHLPFGATIPVQPYTIRQVTDVAVYPNKYAADLVIFERPVDAAKYLVLTLPSQNIGGTGLIRLRIPLEKLKIADD